MNWLIQWLHRRVRISEIEDQLDGAFQMRDWQTVEMLQDELSELRGEGKE